MLTKLDIAKHDIYIGLTRSSAWYHWTLVVDAKEPLIAKYATRPGATASAMAIAMLFKWRLRPASVEMAMEILGMRVELDTKTNTPVNKPMPGIEAQDWESFKIVRYKK